MKDRDREGPIEIALAGDLTENQSQLLDAFLEVKPGEECVIDRTVGFGRSKRDPNRLPRAGGVHRRHKARNLAEHTRRRPPRLVGNAVALEIAEMRFGRDRGELVALDREAEDRDTRVAAGHGIGRRVVALRPS